MGGTVNLFKLDFFLRLVVLAATAAGIALELTSKQTEVVARDPYTGLLVFRSAKYHDSPALIYLVAAMATTCFYSIITIIVSMSSIRKISPSPTVLFTLTMFDAILAGVMASATGAAASVAYIGLKGNSHVNWMKICNVYDKFCKHIGGSLAVSLAAAVALVLLVVLSSYSLQRRCHG